MELFRSHFADGTTIKNLSLLAASPKLRLQDRKKSEGKRKRKQIESLNLKLSYWSVSKAVEKWPVKL